MIDKKLFLLLIFSLVCDDGHELSGTDQFTCENGTIASSIKASSCDPIQCHPVQQPGNGSKHLSLPLSPSGFPIKDSVYTFSCNKFYSLDGPSRMTCKSNGKWTQSKPPRCRPIAMSYPQCC